MSDGWLRNGKYEHMSITSCTGPGTMYEGYAWAFVLHSTESPPGSVNGINSLFRSKPCSAPHFCIDPAGTRRRIQYIPWTWSACALKGGQGGWQTNRGRAVQMEICGRASEAPDWSDDTLWQIADVIADCILDGVPINPHHVSDMTQLSGVLATTTARQRMSPEQWKHFDGITAHVEIPFNDHWDCGKVKSLRIRDLVLEILDGKGRPMPPPSGVGGGASGNEQYDMLQQGMTGGIVKLVQELIIGMGYDCGPAGADGVFGSGTDAAVRRLQSDHGLAVDGVVGPATNAVIAQAYAWATAAPTPPPPPAAGTTPAWPGRLLLLTNPMMNGADVRQWQQRMVDRGWHLTADGWYGLETLSICKSFQSDKGLVIDGVIGRSTWDAAWTAPIT
jgi:peptidoglycan hydrolase-like protein with peptidoglycan-binding domain